MIRVQEFLERVEALHQTIRGRRHERSVPRPCATDPILSGAEFPRLFAAASPCPQQDAVDFADEPQRERKIVVAEATQPKVQRRDVA